MEKKEGQTSGFVVRQSGMAYGVGIFIVLFAAALLVLEVRYHVRAIPVWVYLVIAGIFLLGGYVWLEAWNRRLMVEGDTLYYRNVTGKMVKFAVTDIGYGKAAYHASKGRDYLRLYDKEGKVLCRLECSMKNTRRLAWYLYDNGIGMELEKGAEGFIGDIMAQQPVAEEELGKLSVRVYGEMQDLAAGWLGRNAGMGAEFSYGFACYLWGKRVPGVQAQPEGSRFPAGTGKKAGGGAESLPEDFYCRMELYVEKGGYLVQDRKGKKVMLEIPVFYRRRSEAQGEGIRLYYNSAWQDGMKEGLQWLEDYLPKHRFCQGGDSMGGRLLDRL